MSNDIMLADGEVVDPRGVQGSLAEITRATVLQRIETARTYRRSLDHFMKVTINMLNYSPAMAGKFRYVLPRKDQDGRPIQGVSIRGAKMLASAWGNLDVSGQIVSMEDGFVTARGECTDLESNMTYRTEVRTSIRYKNGTAYPDHLVQTICGATLAKAERNAILSVIPPMFVAVIEEEAIRLTRGDVKSLPDRVNKALTWFAGRGAPEHRVLAMLGVQGRADVTLDHLTILQGARTEIEEGATLDSVFPTPDADPVDVAVEPAAVRRASRAARLADQLPTPRGGGRRTPMIDEGELTSSTIVNARNRGKLPQPEPLDEPPAEEEFVPFPFPTDVEDAPAGNEENTVTREPGEEG